MEAEVEAEGERRGEELMVTGTPTCGPRASNKELKELKESERIRTNFQLTAADAN